MKKSISILLGLLLVASFSLAGCQLGTEPETNTEDAVLNAMMESNATLSEEDKSVNDEEKVDENESASSTVTQSSAAASEESTFTNSNEKVDESEPASSIVTESKVPQTENEVNVNQPEQTAGELRITAEGVPVCKQPLSADSRAAFPGQSGPY